MTRKSVSSASKPRFPAMGVMLSLGVILRSLYSVMVCPTFENNFCETLFLFLMILLKRKETITCCIITYTVTSFNSSILMRIFFKKPHMVWPSVTYLDLKIRLPGVPGPAPQRTHSCRLRTNLPGLHCTQVLVKGVTLCGTCFLSFLLLT